jgi:hypothetical protein
MLPKLTRTHVKLTKEYLTWMAVCYPRLEISTLMISFQLDFLWNYILNLLAATIKAFFTVCREPKTEVRQCPLSLEKWLEMIVGPVQIVLGLSVDTNKMTVGITEEYQEQVRAMLETNWTSKHKFFQARDMQKLIGKIARLGEVAPWIFKLMSHLYTSLAFAL